MDGCMGVRMEWQGAFPLGFWECFTKCTCHLSFFTINGCETIKITFKKKNIGPIKTLTLLAVCFCFQHLRWSPSISNSPLKYFPPLK